MKKIISTIIVSLLCNYNFGQSKCVYSDSAKSYLKDGIICNLSEHYLNLETNTIIYNKYVNGSKVSFTEYDTLMNKIQEFYSTNNGNLSSEWDENGALRHHLIRQDTISYEFFWDEKGRLNQYEEFKDSNRYSVSYYPNGKINSVFNCDYKKDADCTRKIYTNDGNLWFTFLWRPLNFVKIDSLRRTRLREEDVNDNLFPIGPDKVFKIDGSLDQQIFYKYGIVNKVIDYGVDGSEFITLFDDRGKPIEKK